MATSSKGRVRTRISFGEKASVAGTHIAFVSTYLEGAALFKYDTDHEHPVRGCAGKHLEPDATTPDLAAAVARGASSGRVLEAHRPFPQISISLAANFGPLPSSSCFMNT